MARPTVLLTRLWPEEAIQNISRHYDVVVDRSDKPLSQEALRAAMAQYDAICPTVTDRIDEAVLTAPDRKTRILANFGAGYEHIDLQAAQRCGVVVTNTPDVLTDATAELAVMLMLIAARRAGEGERELRAGDWTGWRPTHLVGRSIRGKTLGLIGFGRIAQQTARIAQNAFGMRIAYHSRNRADLPTDLSDAKYHEDLDSLVSDSDVISLHCPGGAATRHLIDRRRLALCKPDAILVNTARGSVIDEDALVDALKSGQLAAAGLDVYEGEPAVHPGLRQLDNAVLLPHLGSATLETRNAMGFRAASNLDAFFNNEEPKDRIA